MTIRMQESEAAANFSRFLAHLEAGDQVQLERQNAPTMMVSGSRGQEQGKGHIDFIVRRLRELEEQHGPILAGDGYTEHMRKAHEEINQPLELRTTWD